MSDVWWAAIGGLGAGFVIGFCFCLVAAALVHKPQMAEPRQWTGDLPAHLDHEEDETDQFLRDLNEKRDSA